MDIFGAKLITSSVFFLVAVCFAFLPFWTIRSYCLKRVTNVTQNSACLQILLVQCLYSLASGVLLGTCLIHLLPESLETFQEAVRSRGASHPGHTNATSLRDNVTSGQDPITGQYPLAELFVSLGFLAVYMLDNGMKSCSKDKNAINFIDNTITDEGVAFLSTDERSGSQNTEARDTDVCPPGQGCDQKHGDAGISKLHHMFKGVTLKMSRTTTPYTPVAQTDTEAGEERLPAILDTTDCESLDNLLPSRSLGPLLRIVEAEQSVTNDQTRIIVRKTPTTSKHLRSAALVAALCVHGFFDGVVVGLQTSGAVVLSLALAVSLHKSFVSVGLSLTLLRTGGGQTSAVSFCVCVLLFAMASPLGILVSSVFLQEMLGESGNGGASMTPACLQTFAVGTFLYVSVVESTEGQQSKTFSVELVKQMSLILGFGLMAGLKAVVGAS